MLPASSSQTSIMFEAVRAPRPSLRYLRRKQREDRGLEFGRLTVFDTHGQILTMGDKTGAFLSYFLNIVLFL